MNCQEFELIVVDLVRGDVTDSALGTLCWAHAASCARCADRLLEQEKLSAGIEALATHTEHVRAPERIEGLLRAEFRKQQAAVNRESIAAPHIQNLPRRVRDATSRLAWAMAAAVVLVPLVAILVAKWGRTPAVTQMVQTPSTQQTTAKQAPDAQNKTTQQTASRAGSKSQAAPKSTLRSAPHKPTGGDTDSKAPRKPVSNRYPTDEVATNFFALPYGSGLTLDDGWALVRVSLPRSALETFGAPPANDKAPTDRVTAEVLLGEDGLARAIRFVR